MKAQTNNLSAPYNFARCLNSQCPKAADCLRGIVARHDTADNPFIDVVNPMCIPADTTHCHFFKPAEKIRVARGIRHLLDNVPHQSAQEMKKRLIAHFGRTKYYRFYRDESYLTPEEQEFIRQLFHEKGIREEPAFESYNEEYKWE